MQARLNQSLRPKYHVRIEERVYIPDENDPGRKVIVPDLKIRKTTAVAEPLIITTMIEDEMHEAYLEVIDYEQRSVVTVIEILSPTNKVSGSRGRANYEQKRLEVMQSPSHFVEIDLLRDGDPPYTRETSPPADYYIHVSKQDARPKGIVWPIQLEQRLPAIDIPLLPEDASTKLELQAILATAYDRAGYDLEIDYKRPAIPPLTPQQNEWAERILKEHSLG